MNVNLHIDSIILDGLDLAAGQREFLQQVVANELTTLFAREGLATSHGNASEVGSISGGTICLGATGPTLLGHQLAQSIHQGFKTASSPSSENVGGPK